LIARDANLIGFEWFIFELRTDVDGATQDCTTLMVDMRADGTDAIWRKDLLAQTRIASRSWR
jgi:hypothetical protein